MIIDFLKVIFQISDTINFRVFSDRKNEDPEFKGKNYSATFGNLEGVLAELQLQNEKNRGVFFVINSGGHYDSDITRINAQFYECDDISIEKQLGQIHEFPLQPSIIVKTRKSLHVYFLMKDAEVSRFRSIQKKLIKYFSGDPTSINESRVYRLPGYLHCKKDPILVEVIEFHPENRYTQDELEAVLPEVVDAPPAVTGSVNITTGQKGLELVCRNCLFMQYCRENPEKISEFHWYAMISNLVVFEGGPDRIHEYSQTYQKYNRGETDAKIKHFMESGSGPMLCSNIFAKGFKCSKNCTCKAPAGIVYEKMTSMALSEILSESPTCGDIIQNIEAAAKFVDDYMVAIDLVIAETFILEKVKTHFGINQKHARSLAKKFLKARTEKQDKDINSDGIDYKRPLLIVLNEFKMISPRAGVQRISDLVIKWFLENEATFYIQPPDKGLMFFEKKLYSISENVWFLSMLYKEGKILHTMSEGRGIIQAIKNTCFIIGKRGFSAIWMYVKKDSHTLFLNLHNEENTILKIGPRIIETINNGVNTDTIVLGTTNTRMEQIEFNPHVRVGEGIRLFKTLVLDNLTCDNSNKFMIGCWFVALFLKSYTKTRPMLKFSGSSSCGKTTAAKLLTALLYGEEKCSQSTSAAMYTSGSTDPLLVLDNLENDNINRDNEQFLLTSSTGITKKKIGPNNTDVVEQFVDCMVILTAIEPLDKAELINRTYDIKFDKQHKTEGFIEDFILTEIQKHRNTILSAFFQIISDDILQDINEMRIKVMRDIAQNPHSKERTNEYLTLMSIISDALEHYFPGIAYDQPAKEQVLSWLNYNDDTAEKTEADTNQNLIFLDLLLSDLKKEDCTENSIRYNMPVFLEFGEVCGFECTTKELYTSFAMICKEKGFRFKLKTPRQLIERLKNDTQVLELHGWQIEKTRFINGNQKFKYMKKEVV